MRKVLFLDCDGVLLDWTQPFLQWHANKIGGPIMHASMVEHYDMTKTGKWPNRDAFFEDLRAFEKDDAWAALPPLCTAMALQVLVNAGVELRVLTLAGHTKDCRARRVRNLSYHFGNVFSGVHFVTAEEPKHEWLAKWSDKNRVGYDVDLLGIVEDKYTTLVDCYKYGITPYGIRQTYNREGWSDSSLNWSPGVDSLSHRLLMEML